MAYVNFDDKLITGFKFFDEGNAKMVDTLNMIDQVRKQKNADMKIVMELFCELLDYYKIQIDKEEKIMIEHDYDNIEYLTKILFPIQLSIIQKKYNNIREGTLIFITENIVEQIKEIIINNIQCDRSFIVFLKTKYHGKIEGILR